jgi:H+/Cl- antiporter ClcA
MSQVSLPTASIDIICYFIIGVFIGIISVGITHSVHFCESLFEKLPIHWMWWPALGGIGVGAIGVVEPKILGAGYETITSILNGKIIGHFAASLFILKFLAWLIGVSSRTTAGTLAPLFMIGACLGVTLSGLISYLFPFIQLDPKIAAMVGMASLFAGVTRAFLASVFITLEATHQFWAAIPVLTGCVAAYLISLFLMQHSILTYSLVKKGIIIPNEQTNVTNNEQQKTDNKK